MHILDFKAFLFLALPLRLILARPDVLLDQVFDVARSGEDGDCSQYREGTSNGLLDEMWREILKMNGQATESMDAQNWDTAPEARKLARTLFGIDEGVNGGEPAAGSMDQRKLAKTRSRRFQAP